MKKILFFLWLPLVLQGCDGSLNSNQEELDQFVLDSSIWTVQLGTGTNDSAQGLSIDSQGNLYLAGYTSGNLEGNGNACLLYTSPSPRDVEESRMPSSA